MKTISDLRENIFEAMQLLKDGKIDVQQAKAMADLGQVIINSAKAETDFIKHSGGDGSGFIPVKVVSPNQLQRPKAEYSNRGHQNILDKYAPEV